MSTPSLLARRRLGSDVVSEPRAAGTPAGTPSLHRSRRPPRACLLLSRFRPQHRRPLCVDDGDAALGPRFCLPSAVMSAASQREHWTKGPTVKLPPTALPCGPRLCYSLPVKPPDPTISRVSSFKDGRQSLSAAFPSSSDPPPSPIPLPITPTRRPTSAQSRP